MADKYVWSGAVGANDGTSWADAYNDSATALADGLATVGAGEIVWVASDHVQTQASTLTLGSASGTGASPVTVQSVDRADDTYLAMTGSITTTANGSISFTGDDIFVGLNFVCDNDIAFTAADKQVILTGCSMSVKDNVNFGSSGNDISVIWNDVSYEQITAGLWTLSGVSFEWFGGTFGFNGGSVTTSLFNFSTSRGNKLQVCDVAFSGLDGDDSLVNIAYNNANTVLIKRCSVPTAPFSDLTTGDITGAAFSARFHSVSSADIIYQFQENYFAGQVNESTSIYLDATYDGTNGYSAAMVSNANARPWTRPLRFKLADIWISATGKTLTVELMTAATLHTDDFWIDVEYVDSTIGALGNIITTKGVITSTVTELTASAKGAGDWEGESGGENFYKVVADFTGAVTDEAIGVYRVYVNLALATTTVYVDPLIVVT